MQAEHPRLTFTQIYNVLEKLRGGERLTEDDEVIKTQGLVLILKELHNKVDTLVAEAYGWPANLSDDEILTRLVALNAERAEEEKRGKIRWLRPDYQRPRAGVTDQQAAAEADAQMVAPLVVEAGKVQKPMFPTDDLERAAAVTAVLMQAREALDAKTIAKAFRQGAKAEAAIARVLLAFTRSGNSTPKRGRGFNAPPSPARGEGWVCGVPFPFLSYKGGREEVAFSRKTVFRSRTAEAFSSDRMNRFSFSR